MTIQITVIGLDQVGASIGLALADQKDKILRVGHDPSAKRMRLVEKDGAFDKTFIHLNEAVRNADMIVISLPPDLIKDALAIIVNELKPDSVVINTSLIRTGIIDWFKQVLPKGQQFISILPLIHGDRLEDGNDDLLTPRADLFANSEIVIASDFETSSKAIEVATDLVALLKGQPYFVDSTEADGIVAAVDQLPKLAAAALVHTLIDKPGWNDGRRFTSRAFYRAASISYLFDEQEYFGITDILNKENTSRALGQLIASLQELQSLIDSQDECALRDYLTQTRQSYETWIEQRKSGDWDAQKQVKPVIPKDMFSRLFGGNPRSKTSE